MRQVMLLGLLVVAACGSETERSIGLSAGSPLLTVTSPQHGETVESPVDLVVARTGPQPSFDYEIGVRVDNKLVTQSPDSPVRVELGEGLHHVRVLAVDAKGHVFDEVGGDEIYLRVDPAAETVENPQAPASEAAVVIPDGHESDTKAIVR